VARGDVGSEVIVAATEIWTMACPAANVRGPAAFQAAHRPQPGFQPPVIGPDRVVRVRSTVCRAEGISSSRTRG
jgi:hypothetical protein